MRLIRPAWSVPGVQAFSTTRTGGVSSGPWTSFNLGLACGDNPDAVRENRRRLQTKLPSPPLWLKQVHGARVIHADEWRSKIEADAVWTDRAQQVLTIQTADCLPILLAAEDGRVIGAAHAGWRGLVADIPGALVEALPVSPTTLMAWIGPGIGAEHYAVGESVREEFLGLSQCLDMAFSTGVDGTLYCDLKEIARYLLTRAGVSEIQDCGLCTASDAERFFSYRRDGDCGRMVSCIWKT
ncbi:MAG: peptidoglycan editing factor PgeF [Wenzhouxiangella sp.]|jgi:YfiH family protein|nr:peptidoglycan editing factor PgeF [Wenzhouxiangella sp.]